MLLPSGIDETPFLQPAAGCFLAEERGSTNQQFAMKDDMDVAIEGLQSQLKEVVVGLRPLVKDMGTMCCNEILSRVGGMLERHGGILVE